MARGKVYLVGAGPGDPGLITVKAKEAIEAADCIIYDYLANEVFLAYARPEAEIIYVGKKGGDHTLSQEEINRLLVKKALEGKVVCRLKGGDPFVFGRGGEEAEEVVAAGIPFEVIPGVTSAVAVPAYAGIPLTHREHTSAVAFVTGHEDPTKESSAIDWDALARVGTLVFFMGVKNLPHIARSLIAAGKSPQTPVAVIRWGTLPRQKTVVGSLENIAEEVRRAGLKAPAIIVVGEVVFLRQKLAWFEGRPLFGLRVLVTRTREQASDLSAKLYDLGAEPVEFPTIKTVAPDDFRPLDQAISEIETFSWIIFTSVNGVRFFFDRLFALGHDVRVLKGVRIAAIGEKTAEGLRAYGLFADLVPRQYRAEGLIEALGQESLSGARILIPRALEAREILPEKLREQGAEVVVAPAYKTIRPEGGRERLHRILEEGLDVVTFTSSSTVRNFVEMIGGPEEARRLLSGVKIASIGPITSQTARDLGLSVDIEPQAYTIVALVEAIREFFGR
ncbi:uroporphyrinogen-III C-methyltransferase [Thermosulfuriphilus sp.]